ncbi:MAG TPA: SBBP repeat-containing protein [Bryobacteraceae bacterium]|nr:SBBP repeat-containing protein [Bryobacteraceae bacterium]
MQRTAFVGLIVLTSQPLALPAGLNYFGIFGDAPFSGVTDAAGNVYVAGSTSVPNLPATAGAFQTTVSQATCGFLPSPFGGPPGTQPCFHGFVAKIDPTGTRLIYLTYLGGEQEDWVGGISVDAEGNAYITGATGSLTFPVTAGAWQTTVGNHQFNGFLTKLKPDGSGLVYSTFIPGGQGSQTAVDAAGNVFVVGTAYDADFPTTAGAFQTKRIVGHEDVFVLKLNAAGSGLVYSTLIGGTFTDVGRALAIDASGNAYVGGYTASIPAYAGLAGSSFKPFPTTPGAVNRPGFGADAFIAKVNPSGTALVYSTVFGGHENDEVGGLTIGSDGAAYFGGSTGSADFPATPDAFGTRPGLGFAGKLSADGSHLLYSTYLPGAGSPVSVDAAGNAVITGMTYNSNLPTTTNALLPCFPAYTTGDYSAKSFVIELNALGTAALYSSFVKQNIVATDGSGRLYLASDTAILDQFDIFAPAEPGIRCIVNAASFRGQAIAPGEIVSLFGANIGPKQAAGAVVDSSGKIATNLNNTRVLIGGIAAPLLYVSEHQINAVVPFGVSGLTNTTVQVETKGQSLPPFVETVTDADPGIFTLDGSGHGQAAALNEDGTVNSPAHPAAQGSVVSLFVTGMGVMQPVPADGFIPAQPFAKPVLPVKVQFAAGPPTTDFAYIGDAPRLVEGAVQINIRVPQLYGTGKQAFDIIAGNEIDWGNLQVTIFVQ